MRDAYQLALRMPGRSPVSASCRKQMRQMPKYLIYALGLPQRWHRLYFRTGCLGSRIHFWTIDFFAKVSP